MEQPSYPGPGASLGESALWYAARGWPVFPLRPGDKRPYEGSAGFKDATTDLATVATWWNERPDSNIGLATGPDSGLYVVDVDEGQRSDGTAKAGLSTLEKLEAEHEALPTTLAALTPSGGRHLYFSYPEEGRWGNTSNRIGPDVDTRGDGGYVLLAPSETAAGPYVWLAESDPAALPTWLLGLLARRAHEHEETEAGWERDSSEVSKYVAYAVSAEVDELARMGPDSGRNERLNRAAFSLGTIGAHGALTEDYARAALLSACETCGLLADDGLAPCLKTFASGWAAGMQAPRSPWPPKPQGGERIDFEGPAPLSDPRIYFDKEDGLLAYKLAGDVVRVGPLAVGRDEEFWSYHSGVWSHDKHAVMQRVVRLLRNRYRKGYCGAVEDVVRTYVSRIECDPISDYINTLSGMLDWRTGEIAPHSPDLHSTVQVPWEWDPAAECPEFDRFLSQVTPPDLLPMMWEFIGYMLYSGNPLQVAFLLFGSGANGKGTLLRVIQALLGKSNTSAVSLDSLSSNRFSPASLYGKIANLAGDIDATYQESTAQFKRITGEDMLDAERKFGHAFQFENWAVPVFSANKIPGSADTSEGYRRRWVVIPFPHSFEGGKADRHLTARLVAELPGIAARAVPALRTLLLRGYFELGESATAAQETFSRAIDQVRAWIDDACDRDPEMFVNRTILYNSYKMWANANGHRPVRASEFYERLGQAGCTAHKRDGNRGFFGIFVRDGRMQGDRFEGPGQGAAWGTE